jgi:hypothetical protein
VITPSELGLWLLADPVNRSQSMIDLIESADMVIVPDGESQITNCGTAAFAFSNIDEVGWRASATDFHIRRFACAFSPSISPLSPRHGCGYALANTGQDTRAIQAWCATPNSHRPVQKLRALIDNPRASQQLMGQFANRPIAHLLLPKGEKVQ